MEVNDIKIRGAHNISNALAAAAACFAFGVGAPQIREGISNFKGIPHRLAFVGEKRGVKYFNDSAATIPEAVISAINSFTEPITLIAGGNDKELDFSQLAETMVKKVKNLVLLKGNATEKLLDKIRKNLPDNEKEKEFTIVDSMERAVSESADLARDGEVLLFLREQPVSVCF